MPLFPIASLYTNLLRFILQKKSEYIDDDGNVIKFPGEEYDEDGVRVLY
jgi:chlorophyll(ide) b reductase